MKLAWTPVVNDQVALFDESTGEGHTFLRKDGPGTQHWLRVVSPGLPGKLFESMLGAQLDAQARAASDGFEISNPVAAPEEPSPEPIEPPGFTEGLLPYHLYAAVGMLLAAGVEATGHEYEKRIAVRAHTFAVQMVLTEPDDDLEIAV